MFQLESVPRGQRILFILCGLALLLVPLLVPLPTLVRDDPTLNILGDRAHVFIFAGMTWLVHAIGPLRGRPLACAVAAAAVGASTEFLQQFVGRSPMLSDFALDLLGIGFAMTWIQWRRQHRRAALAAAAFLLSVLAYTVRDVPQMFRAMVEVRRSFPLLAEFESRDTLALWRKHGDSVISLVDVGSVHGHVLQVSTAGREPWPGVGAGRLPADWTGYDELVLDVRLQSPAPDSLQIGVRLDDFEGRDDREWSSRSYFVHHAWQTLRFPLVGLQTDKSGRPLDVGDIFSLVVFFIRPGAPAAFEVDNVRLVPAEPRI